MWLNYRMPTWSSPPRTKSPSTKLNIRAVATKSVISLLGVGWGVITGALGLICFSLLASSQPIVDFIVFFAWLPVVIAMGIWGSKVATRFWAVVGSPTASSYQKRQKTLITAQIILMLPGLFVVLLISPFNPVNPPSDEVMLTHFTRNEAKLNRLVQMIHNDQDLEAIHKTWTSPEMSKTGIDSVRLCLYRRILTEAGVARVHAASAPTKRLVK